MLEGDRTSAQVVGGPRKPKTTSSDSIGQLFNSMLPPPSAGRGTLDMDDCHRAGYELGIKQGMLMRLLKPGGGGGAAANGKVGQRAFVSAVTHCFELNAIKGEGEMDMNGAVEAVISKHAGSRAGGAKGGRSVAARAVTAP